VCYGLRPCSGEKILLRGHRGPVTWVFGGLRRCALVSRAGAILRVNTSVATHVAQNTEASTTAFMRTRKS
jgi:hypothetical protein